MFPPARRPRMSRVTLSIIVATLAILLGGGPDAVRGQAPTGEDKIGVLEAPPGNLALRGKPHQERKTGGVAPLTGNPAFEAKRHMEGLEVVRDLINERGGVMGKKLVFAVADATD